MKRMIIVFSLGLMLLITGCKGNKNDKVLCNGKKVSGLTEIKDIYKLKDGKTVKVCGVISAWDTDDNFFIQDNSDGIYVVGKGYLGEMSHDDVGKTVIVKATKGTYKGNVQLKATIKGYDVVDTNKKRPEPVILENKLSDYKNKLIMMQNIKLNVQDNNVQLLDKNNNFLANLYNSNVTESANSVSIIGVYYELSDDKIFVLSDYSDITFSDEYYVIPTDFDYDGPLFPTDSLNKEFWDKGGGSIEVSLDYCTDGDTAGFKVEGRVYHTRFFNIDTQESTSQKEEWGKPASIYTCNVLSSAEEIYLQSDLGDGPFDKYDRLLAWIWVDGELLQYHLTRLGLAEVKYLYGAETYTNSLLVAEQKAKDEELGQWGDLLDPYWDYNNDKPKGW